MKIAKLSFREKMVLYNNWKVCIVVRNFQKDCKKFLEIFHRNLPTDIITTLDDAVWCLWWDEC